MEARSREVRAAFVDASQFALSLIDSVAEDAWDRPGLGTWSVRELAVHLTRAWSTVATYADQRTDLSIHSATEYYVAALSGSADLHDQVARRTRDQAAALSEPVPAYARRAFADTETVVERTPADAVLATPAGGIRLVDYLPTRVVELVVHGIDLADAIGVPAVVPTPAMELTLELLVDLATERPGTVDPADLVRALTGRAPLRGELDLLA